MLIKLASVYKVDLDLLQGEGRRRYVSCAKSLPIRCCRVNCRVIRK
jgi:hypothetical protein